VTVSGTLIGFDFGERRIGVAVGETSTRIANPLGAIEQSANDARFREIGRLVDEWRPAGFVVGRPRHADDSEHAVGKLAEKFARRLQARYQLPIAFVDETLTSATAEADLRGLRTRAARKADIDALAAAMILQSYLDSLSPPDAENRNP
jgi:putative Holliday junction resolvase